jgi:hypothetical protein
VLFPIVALVFAVLSVRLVLHEFGRVKSAGDRFLDGYARVLQDARRAIQDVRDAGEGDPPPD